MRFRKVEKSQTRNRLEEDFKKQILTSLIEWIMCGLMGDGQGHHPNRELKKQGLCICEEWA